jgi:hypothetical protein
MKSQSIHSRVPGQGTLLTHSSVARDQSETSKHLQGEQIPAPCLTTAPSRAQGTITKTSRAKQITIKAINLNQV